MNSVSDLQWLLWAIPLSVAILVGLGWWLRGFEQRQWRLAASNTPQAHFRGLNHLLNEQHDEAIDSFIEAVQHDPETSELHFALGNLFRRRGDYDRAVRVHEHLLRRGDLKLLERQRAQHELARDFLKAGLLDRAEEALHALEGSAHEEEARLALLSIYERARDWEKAISVAQKLDGGPHGSFSSRMAHYHCELAALDAKHERLAAASDHIHAALHLDPQHTRAHIDLAKLQYHQGLVREAIQTLQRAAQRQPASLPLMSHLLASWGGSHPDHAPLALEILSQQPRNLPSTDVTMSRLKLAPEQAAALLEEHLSHEPSLAIAAQSLQGVREALPAHVLDTINRAASPLQRYRCAACGFEAHTYFWQCPGCQAWDSFPNRRVEEL